MNPAEIATEIQQKTGVEVTFEEGGPEQFVTVPAEQLLKVMHFLNEDPQMQFDCLMSQAGVHEEDTIYLYYHLYSYAQKHRLTVVSSVPLEKPEVDSVVEIWKGADWLERETYDLLGVIFKGHPDLRRLMLPEDWTGHPLRKDYKKLDTYQSIDNSPSAISLSFVGDLRG